MEAFAFQSVKQLQKKQIVSKLCLVWIFTNTTGDTHNAQKTKTKNYTSRQICTLF